MGKFELPPLPYAYNALEPYISEQIMKLHHDKHHQTYLDNLNKAIDAHPEWGKSIEEIIRTYDKAPDDIKTVLRNHGGGYYNHSLFWLMMAPKSDKKPSDKIMKFGTETAKQFGSNDAFKKQFSEAAAKIFGSGWEWLVIDEKGRMSIMGTPNQDSPLTQGKIPLLGLDVWEHSYYLQYFSNRAAYIEAWWNVVNWEDVAERFERAKM